MIEISDYYCKQVELLVKTVEQHLDFDTKDVKLCSSKRGDSYEFYTIVDDERKYYGLDSEELVDCFVNWEASYYESVLENVASILHGVSKRLAAHHKKYTKSYGKLASNRILECKPELEIELARHLLDTDDEEKIRRIIDPRGWAKENSYKNPYRPELLRYETNRGMMMRSKSEVLWANLLDKHGIVFAYEPAVIINGRIFYPDFMLVKVDGSLVIIEHLGLMDNPDYRDKAYKKLDEYRAAGFSLGRNLIVTTEEDLVVEGRLEELLLRMYYI